MSSLTVVKDDDDPWLAADKLQHVAFCFSLACIGFFALAGNFSSSSSSSSSTPTPARRLGAGALLAFFGGALKELGDFLGWWPGRPSLRDAAADALGAALGLSACALSVAFDGNERIAREWRRWRMRGGGGVASADEGTARPSRGEYRGLELASSAAAEGKV
jgi:hypothetical protein